MKHEERTPMKLFKTLCSNALIFAMGVIAVLILMAIVGQALALSFYAFLFAAATSAIAFLFFRRSNDSSSNRNS